MNPNVFSALSEYGSNARENYLTEAYVFLLKLLLDRGPSVGFGMVNQLCGLKKQQQMTKLYGASDAGDPISKRRSFMVSIFTT